MRAGYVVIVGLPNVGKSTLLNRLLNIKLSIVSRKPQTTRNKIIGILTEGENQAIFVDTPGIISPKYELHKMMVKTIKDALADADLVVWLTEPCLDSEEDQLLKELLPRHICLAAINKIDLIERKDLLLPIIDRYHQIGFEEIFLISALTGEGLEGLKKAIFNRLPIASFYYPEDQLTEHPERFFVGELVREQIFESYGEELPYAAFVTVEEFKERDQGNIISGQLSTWNVIHKRV